MTSLPKGKIVVPVWSDDEEIKALTNDDGRIPVNVENLPTTIDSQGYGWDGSAWHKLPLVWGYSDIQSYVFSYTFVAGGNYAADMPDVDDDEVWWYQHLAAKNIDSICTIEFSVRTPSVGILLNSFADVPANELQVVTNLPMALKATQLVRVDFVGCGANDKLRAYAWGYKMKVAE